MTLINEVVPLLVDGKSITSSDGPRFAVINAVTGETIHYGQGATVEEAELAAHSASVAFPAWSTTPAQQKRSLFNQAAQLLGERRDDFVQSQILEVNCTEKYAQGQVDVGIAFLEEMGALSTNDVLSGTIPQSFIPDAMPLVVPVPYGTVLGICPWNGTIILGLRAIGTPLAAGNTTVMKGSELCPKTHYMLAKLFNDAGFPPGVVNFVTHSPEDASKVVTALIEHPAIRKLNFTGSSATGRIVAGVAARALKPVVLELGGKCPMIVLEDADINLAAEAAVVHAYFNSGQVCMSTERIIVERSVANRFRAAFLVEFEKLASKRWGVVSHCSALRIESIIQDAVDKGADVHVAGNQTLREEASFASVAVFGTTPSMSIYKEETFGPCTAILEAESAESAIGIANESAFGLSASLFCGNSARAIALAKRLRSGAVHINAGTFHDEHTLPHGGMKDSGWGRFGGKWGISEYLQTQTIIVHGVNVTGAIMPSGLK